VRRDGCGAKASPHRALEVLERLKRIGVAFEEHIGKPLNDVLPCGLNPTNRDSYIRYNLTR